MGPSFLGLVLAFDDSTDVVINVCDELTRSVWAIVAVGRTYRQVRPEPSRSASEEEISVSGRHEVRYAEVMDGPGVATGLVANSAHS